MVVGEAMGSWRRSDQEVNLQDWFAGLRWLGWQQSEVRCRWLGGQALGFPKYLPEGWGGAVDAELEKAVDAKLAELLQLHGPPEP